MQFFEGQDGISERAIQNGERKILMCRMRTVAILMHLSLVSPLWILGCAGAYPDIMYTKSVLLSTSILGQQSLSFFVQVPQMTVPKLL